MDTNLIDSCREATGEANRAGNDVTGEFRALKNNGEQMVKCRLIIDLRDLHDQFFQFSRF